MGKTITFQAVNNRIQFRCPHCSAKRNMAVPGEVRKRSVRCYKCSERANCVINRRMKQRSYQEGKVVVLTDRGKSTEVYLHDISENGAAFDLPLGNIKINGITTGKMLKFKCGWNPALFGNSSYKVQNVHGRRVGVQKIC